MKFLKKAVLVLVVMALWAAPAMAGTTTADLYFTVGNISNDNGVPGGLGQFTLGNGEYFADLHIVVNDAGKIAHFTLNGGTGTYLGNPVNFAFMGKSPLGLNVTGTYDLTPTNLAKTQFRGDAGAMSVAQPAAEDFNGWGRFNTAIHTAKGGFANSMSQITFDSTQTFADANAVLAALTGNSDNHDNYLGFLGVVDMGGYYPGTTDALFTGTAHNGEPSSGDSNVPIPPTVWLMGSGLVGLVGLRRLRKG